jgi:hypothetical protein
MMDTFDKQRLDSIRAWLQVIAFLLFVIMCRECSR